MPALTPSDLPFAALRFILSLIAVQAGWLLSAPDQSAVAAPGVDQSVVKINVTARAPDYFQPWTKASPSKLSGSGVVIAGPRILTNAHVVTFASEVLVQLRQGGDQLAAKVTAIAPGMDLAIVELNDPQALEGIEPLSLADQLPQPKSSVSVYGYPTGGDDLSVTEGIVSRVEFADYYYETVGTRIQVDAALNPGNSGGPAIQDGKIAGLVFSKIVEAENIGYLIPAEEIQEFLSDTSDGHYDGKLYLYDIIFTLENEALRDALKIPDQLTGILVAEPSRRDDDYSLKKWDVITHVGPNAIDNQGYVGVRDGLRLKFLYFVPKLQSNGEVELTIWRDGQPQVIHVPVIAERDYVIPFLKGRYPEYFIDGPLVFTAATQEYVRTLSRGGDTSIQYLLALKSPLLNRLYDTPAEPGEQLVLTATRMFPHPIIKGYDNRGCGVVASLNGERVKSLRHLAELLRDCNDEFVRFEMADRNESLIFRRKELDAATEETLNSEGIRYQASEGLRDVWKSP